MITSRIKVKHLARVFNASDPSKKAMHVQMARLCVLYEDLRIEHAGAEQEKIAELDFIDLETRRFYFVRRTVGTLGEISQAINKLNMIPAFKEVRQNWSPEMNRGWDGAVRFFAAEQQFLREWRDDVGGHFLDRAAEYAIEHVDSVGSIEYYRRAKGADVKLRFAYDLVAVALTRKQETGETVEVFIRRAFTFMMNAVSHSIDAVQIMVHGYLGDRFRI
jgi:hypothetical protein